MRTLAFNRSRRQRGMSIVVVLMLLTVMLLGGLALARMTETGALVYGNVASKDATIQASDLGINEAFSLIPPAATQDVNQGNWYWSAMRPVDANGIPQVDFDAAPQIKVGTIEGSTDARYDVRYVIERMCSVTPVTNLFQQCLLRLKDPKVANIGSDSPAIQPMSKGQFRITVRVTDKRGTTTWVQTLATL